MDWPVMLLPRAELTYTIALTMRSKPGHQLAYLSEDHGITALRPRWMAHVTTGFLSLSFAETQTAVGILSSNFIHLRWQHLQLLHHC
jgi:hypothetical protein